VREEIVGEVFSVREIERPLSAEHRDHWRPVRAYDEVHGAGARRRIIAGEGDDEGNAGLRKDAHRRTFGLRYEGLKGFRS